MFVVLNSIMAILFSCAACFLLNYFRKSTTRDALWLMCPIGAFFYGAAAVVYIKACIRALSAS